MSKPVVAIVGRPNVGKSTLFNRLVKKRKAIVGKVPGITRDRNYAVAEFDDRPFILIDTGGFDPDSRDPMLKQMKLQVQLAVEEADHILFVLDVRAGLTPIDRDVYDFIRAQGKEVFPVINKVDSPKQDEAAYEFYELGLDRLITISAEHSIGIHDLMEEVVQSFPVGEPSDEQGPMRISVIGKPNAGKSTLINSLVGKNRLITSEIPGTTRDTIDTPFEYNGQSYLLVDTAGIRRRSRISQRIESFSVMMVFKSLAASDLCLILIDATEGMTEQDAKIAGLAHEAGVASILLVNKWDLVEQKDSRKAFLEDLQVRLKFMDYIPVLFVSALTRLSLHKLFPLIERIKTSYYQRVPTAKVNRVLQDAVNTHTPPYYRRRRVKFFYGTQALVAPPTFFVFVNTPAGVHFSYLRYLTNSFRKHLGFSEVPLRIFLKKRK